MKRRTAPLLLCLLIVGCDLQPIPRQMASQTPSQTATATPSYTPTYTASVTLTPTLTHTPTFTDTPTLTYTPTDTETPTITLSPTFNFPKATVRTAQAPCMYGPSMEYLWQIGLFKGDTGEVKGRSPYNNWLYVLMNGYHRYCWIPGNQLDVIGDVNTVIVQPINLPMAETGFYGPPPWVEAERNGDEVTISWGEVWMTEDDDRGYFLDLFVCQNGQTIWWPKHIENQYQTTYTVRDEAACSKRSGGLIYTVEKHGYLPPLVIPWPK